MTNYLELLEKQRTILLKKTEHLTTDQYNLVPSGFNNNIIWNMGHSLIVSESILYSNILFGIPQHGFDIEGFKKGTKPELVINDYDIILIRQSMSDTVPLFRKLLKDVATASSSSPIPPLVSEESLRFMLFHEEIHFTKIRRILAYV